MVEGEDYDDEEEVFDEDDDIEPLPASVCRMGHSAHESCTRFLIQLAEETGQHSCPRCIDLLSRCKATSSESPKMWCQGVSDRYPDGFSDSPKIQKCVQLVQNVPAEDKILVPSFFKGSLDLMEGILEHDLQLNTARFDGDLGATEKTAELERFLFPFLSGGPLPQTRSDQAGDLPLP